MHSLPFIEVIGFVACQTTSKHLGKDMQSGLEAISRPLRMESRKILVANHWRRAILYTSPKLEEDQLLRNLDASGDPDHVVFRIKI